MVAKKSGTKSKSSRKSIQNKQLTHDEILDTLAKMEGHMETIKRHDARISILENDFAFKERKVTQTQTFLTLLPNAFYPTVPHSHNMHSSLVRMLAFRRHHSCVFGCRNRGEVETPWRFYHAA